MPRFWRSRPWCWSSRRRGNIHGFNLTRQHPAVEFTMGGYSVQVSLDQVFGNQAETGFGLVMMTSDESKPGGAEFLGVGKGFRVIFASRTPGQHVGFAAIDEGRYDNGTWMPGRRLNGDETDQGAAWRFDQRAIRTEKATIYRY